MTDEELFYPEYLVEIGNYELRDGVAFKISSSKSGDTDWGKVKFTAEFQNEVRIEKDEDVTISLGYDGSLKKVFKGIVASGYNQGASADEISVQDFSAKLAKTKLNDSFKNCTPQEIIMSGLTAAGITDYKLSEEVYLPKAVLPVANKNMIDVLKQINTAWRISATFGFIGGIFYWGITPKQSRQYILNYGDNIISLERESDFWVLETVCTPDMQQSQKINVNHPKVSGEFTIEKLHILCDESGFIRYRIYF